MILVNFKNGCLYRVGSGPYNRVTQKEFFDRVLKIHRPKRWWFVCKNKPSTRMCNLIAKAGYTVTKVKIPYKGFYNWRVDKDGTVSNTKKQPPKRVDPVSSLPQ